MNKTKIAKNTKITDEFLTTVSGVDSSQITEYNNGNIKFDNKIYNSTKKEDFFNQLIKKFGDISAKALNRLSNQNVTKILLTQNNSEFLKKVIIEISKGIIKDNNILKDAFDAKSSQNYIFQIRKNEFGGSDQEENQGDKQLLKNQKLEEYKNKAEEIQKNAKQDISNIKKQFVKDNKGKSQQEIQLEAENKQTVIQNRYKQMISELTTQVLDKMKNEGFDQQYKTIKENTDNLEDKIDEFVEVDVNDMISKLNENNNTKYQIVNINGKDRKIKRIKKYKQLSLIKTPGSNRLKLLDQANKKILISNIEESDIENYAQQNVIRVNSDGIRKLFSTTSGTMFNNSFVAKQFGELAEQFYNKYFIILHQGDIEVRLNTEGIDGSTLLTAKTKSSLINKIKNDQNWKDYLQETNEQEQEEQETTDETSEESTFDQQHFNSLAEDEEKADYLKSLGNIQIKLTDYDEKTAEDLALLKFYKRNELGNVKIAKVKNIKISRANRHLSLEKIALNKIFKILK